MDTQCVNRKKEPNTAVNDLETCIHSIISFIYIQVDPKRLEGILDICRTSLNELNVHTITMNTLLHIYIKER